MNVRGIVASFHENGDGSIDGLRLHDGTEVRFRPGTSEKLLGVSIKDRVTIEGWKFQGESEIHATTMRNEATGRVLTLDRLPQDDKGQSGTLAPGDEADDRPPPRLEDGGAGPRPGTGKDRSARQAKYSLEQAVSDHAQLHTIAFDGLAFLTGNFGMDTFLPPGKVSDYFGFQYMRDIDAAEGGHNTSFLTRIAYNMLAILNDEQKARLVALGKEQENDIRRLAEMRLPLIKAFRRNSGGRSARRQHRTGQESGDAVLGRSLRA